MTVVSAYEVIYPEYRRFAIYLKEVIMIIIATDDTFEKVVTAGRPVLVDFWAAWCGPCLAMEPTIEKLADEFDGRVDIAKLNVDENPHIAQQFGVMSIPTLILFKDGVPVERIVGITNKQALTEILNA